MHQLFECHASTLAPGGLFGDWYIGESFNGESKCVLYLGDATHPSVDGMLGDASNRVILRRRSTLAYFAGAEESANCRRRISGNGAVSCTGDFRLTDEAHFSPCGITGSGYGTISISSTGSLIDSEGTIYRLRCSAGNGFHVFAEGNATDGWTLYAEKGISGLLFILR